MVIIYGNQILDQAYPKLSGIGNWEYLNLIPWPYIGRPYGTWKNYFYI